MNKLLKQMKKAQRKFADFYKHLSPSERKKLNSYYKFPSINDIEVSNQCTWNKQ